LLAGSLQIQEEPEVAMKLKYIIGASALSLILAGAAYPQQEQEKEKPQQEEQRPAEKPKTQQKQEQPSAKQQQQEQKNEQKQEKQAAKQNEQKPDQTNKQRQDQEKQVTKQQQEEQKQQQRQQQSVAKQQRTDEQHNEQRSGGGHGRIPDDRFRASFGREHHFRVGHIDNRRFQYGGYWFVFNDPWPVAWAYEDDFYIDYIDGQYYLIDLTHPGIQLLLVIE
jgi:outer membrane biosynthesis protein TonB